MYESHAWRAAAGLTPKDGAQSSRTSSGLAAEQEMHSRNPGHKRPTLAPFC